MKALVCPIHLLGHRPETPIQVVLEALLAKHGDLQAQDSTGATPSGTQERGGGLGRGRAPAWFGSAWNWVGQKSGSRMVHQIWEQVGTAR